MQCTDKKRYRTKSIAKKAVKRQKRRYGNQYWTYLCPMCGTYHLTKMRQKRAK
jgi:predicted RNA-binding Zn-ribbon protein involved in translation (DUF1610 family)